MARKGRQIRPPGRLFRPSRGWRATPRVSERWCSLSGTGAISGPVGAVEGTKEVPGSPRNVRPRLAALPVERGLGGSRAEAQGLVLSGAVRVDGKVVTKAGFRVEANAEVTVER